MDSANTRPPNRGPLSQELPQSTLSGLTLDRVIEDRLRWPFPGWASPDAAKVLREILSWLKPEDKHVLEVVTQVVNMAIAYRAMLDDQQTAGHWKEGTQQLQKIAKQAELLASRLSTLGKGARLIWMHAEARTGVLGPGNGLFPALHLDRMPNLSDFKIDQEQGWVCTKQMDLPTTTGPEVDVPIKDLADRLAQVIAWAKDHRGSIGKRTVSTLVMGSPELELFRDTKIGLLKMGFDPRKSYELGCHIHHFVTGENPPKHWGDDANRKMELWFAKVGLWIGREHEAPETIKFFVAKGTQHRSTTQTNQGKVDGSSSGETPHVIGGLLPREKNT